MSSPVDVSVHARFTTHADADAIQHAACSSEMRMRTSGADVPIVVRVERASAVVACVEPRAPSGATTRVLVVRIVESTHGARDVLVDMDLGDESPVVADDMLEILATTSSDLERRLPVPYERSRAFSPSLTALGITLGGVGLATIAASYVWLGILLIQPASCSAPLSVAVPVFGSCLSAGDYLQTEVLEVAGIATMVIGATLAIVGQQRVRITPVVAPIRSGLTGAITVAF